MNTKAYVLPTIDADKQRLWLPKRTLALCYADVDGHHRTTRRTKHFSVLLALILYARDVSSSCSARIGTLMQLSRFLCRKLHLGSGLTETGAVKALRQSRGFGLPGEASCARDVRDCARCELRSGAPFRLHYDHHGSLVPLDVVCDKRETPVLAVTDALKILKGSEGKSISLPRERAELVEKDWASFVLMFDIHGTGKDAIFSLYPENFDLDRSTRLERCLVSPAYVKLVQRRALGHFSTQSRRGSLSAHTSKKKDRNDKPLDLLLQRALSHVRNAARFPSTLLDTATGHAANPLAPVVKPSWGTYRGSHSSVFLAVRALEAAATKRLIDPPAVLLAGIGSWLERHYRSDEKTFYQYYETGSGPHVLENYRYTALSSVSALICGMRSGLIEDALRMINRAAADKPMATQRAIYDSIAILICADYFANALRRGSLPKELSSSPVIQQLGASVSNSAFNLLSFGPMRLLPVQDHRTVFDSTPLYSVREYAICIHLAASLNRPLDPGYLWMSVVESADNILSMKSSRTLSFLAPHLMWIGLAYERMVRRMSGSADAKRTISSYASQLIGLGVDWLASGGEYERFASAECSAGITYLLCTRR